jgi:glutathione synthase/RimK-type ligase-like ATP-grasp enzyme
LAIAHGESSVSAMKVAEAAAPVCDLVWLVDSSELSEPHMLRLLRKLGTTIDTVGMSEDEMAEALRPCRPDGVIAFAEYLIPNASAMASRLGLEYHNDAVTRRLVDKFEQRQALRDSGLPVPRFVVVPPRPSPDDLDRVAAGVSFPVVVKPRRGAGSRDTVLVHDIGQLQAVFVDPPTSTSGEEEPMIVEEFLVGDPSATGPSFADYLSVESVVSGGQLSHVAVTGRFPPAEPFRETGLFIPSDIDFCLTEDVLDVATKAITALEIGIGFLHTEIKLTPNGPQVIEVNGRLGGSVPEMAALALGLDLFELSLRVAAGEHVSFDGLPPTKGVGYLFSPHSPKWARRVLSVDGLDRVGEYPGVKTVFLNRKPGDEIDWRKGSHEYVFSVIGAVSGHDDLLEVKRFIDEEVTVTYA